VYAWKGTILRVNLTSGEIKKEKLSPQDAKDYIGARGLASKILYDEVDPSVDPLGPDNKLMFATGPLTGTYATSGGRYNVVTKGPLTGAIAASNSGGYFGPELKYAGYDLVIFEGRAKKPVYLHIYNDEVELRDAGDLWGKDTHETTEKLVERHGENFKVACIGPGGEQQVLFANVINDMHRAAGRSGVGAVMGSKQLKAIVVRGTTGLKVADNQGFTDAVMRARKAMQEDPTTSEGLPTFGTNVLVNVINQSGLFPTRNFQESFFPEADKTSGETMASTLLVRNKGCFACIIDCGRVTAVPEGPYKGEGEGPEYETAWAFGAQCGVDDLEAISKANYICNELGIDTITMGSTIACAMELYEKGIVTEDDVGMDLSFGNAEAMVKMTEAAGLRRGFGDKLALGSHRLASEYGVPELSMSVKRLEMPAYDPRGAQGMALEYATSNRGGCHVRGYMISPEIMGVPQKLDPDVTEEKAAWLKTFQDLTAALDSSGICLFTTFAIGADEISAMLSKATGVEYSTEAFMEAGDRIYNLERLFNMEAGFTHEEDTLPRRLLEEPISAGPGRGKVARLDEMKGEYYQVRGWAADGKPTAEKLAELGL